MKMKSYNIFIKQNTDNSAIENVILVKEGFCFTAFLFSFLWLLFTGLYLFAVLFIILNLIVFAIFSTTIAFGFFIILSILIGLEANNLLLYRFQRKNYYFIGYTTGNNVKSAKLRFLDEINNENKDKIDIVH